MLSHRYRIVAPLVVAGLIAAGAAVPSLETASSPDLAAVTPQHLIEKVLDEKVSHLSGTVEWTAQLGLPSLSALSSGGGQSVSTSSGFDPTSLLSGTHTFDVWIDGARLQRIAAPGTLSETDLVHRGDQAWLYDSATDHVTHYVPRPGSTVGSTPPQPLDAMSVTAIADNVLRQVRSIGTTVSLASTTKVAGRAAYVLRLTPDRAVAANRSSTVSSVTVAVDAGTGLPLRVALFAVGQSSPALQIGYSKISYATPSASLFAVPTGQTTSTQVVGSGRRIATYPPPAIKAPPALGTDWGAIANLPAGAAGSGAGGEIDSVTTVASGPWGQGRLLESTLVNALFLDNGRVLIGAVTPAALETAAGTLAATPG